MEHPDLQANIWQNPGEASGNGVDDDGNGYIDDVNGFDFVSNTGSVSADNHGTHVSGTIGAVSDGSGVVGVSWNVKIISAKFMGPSGACVINYPSQI